MVGKTVRAHVWPELILAWCYMCAWHNTPAVVFVLGVGVRAQSQMGSVPLTTADEEEK